MEINCKISIVESLGSGIWKVNLSPGDISNLGSANKNENGRSVIGLKKFKILELEEKLEFNIKDVTVLNAGIDGDCIVISLELNESSAFSERFGSKSSAGGGAGSGDRAFVEACRTEKFPDGTVDMIQNFLKRIREFSDDRLQEGKHRKWVTYPKNFLALTIQNRNKQFCVHVKKTRALVSLSDVLDIRDDRPGYVRFWLKNESQCDAAIKAATWSFGA